MSGGGRVIRASVVIPARGRTDLLVRVLRLLDGQREAGFESIVVADRCPATVRAVADLDLEHPCRLYAIPGPPDAPFGAAEARNLGASLARGALLVFLDADCLVGPDHVAGFLAPHEPHEQDEPHHPHEPEGLWIAPIDFVCEEDWTKPLARELRPAFAADARPPAGVTEAAWLGSQCWTGNMAVDRAAFLALGGFDLAFTGLGGEDVDYGLRHAARFGRVARAPSRVRHVGPTAAFAHARGERGPLDASVVAAGLEAGRYRQDAGALVVNGGAAGLAAMARDRAPRDLRAGRAASAPPSSAPPGPSVADVFRTQAERSAAALVAIARRLDRDRALAGDAAGFLSLYAGVVAGDPAAFAHVWSDPAAHAWVRRAFEALERVVRSEDGDGDGDGEADAARRALATALDAFGPLALACAHEAGEACSLPRGFRFAGRLPLPGTPFTLVAESGAELRGVASDGWRVARPGDPGPGAPLGPASAGPVAGVSLETCPTVAWRDETIRLQPSVFASPLAAGRGRVVDAGVRFQAEHAGALLAALRLVERLHPEAAELSERLRVVAFNAPGTSQLGNTSSSELPGAVALSPTTDPWDLAETLVHELHHQRLFALEMEGPLFTSEAQNEGRDLRHYSPWRVEPRPMKGVLHAFTVFEAVGRFWWAALGDPEAPHGRARARLALLSFQLPLARDTLRREACLSPRGVRLVEEAERRMEETLARVASAGIDRSAAEREARAHVACYDTAHAIARLRPTLRFEACHPQAARRGDAAPRVSCLCVTRGRVERLARAVACFQAQTHPDRELVVAYEDDDRETAAFVEALADGRPEVVPVRVPREPRLPLGELRNRAVAASRGELVCQWDDDDWHHPDRLAAQVAAVEGAPGAVACVLSRWTVFDETRRRAYLGPWRDWEGSLLCRRDALPTYPALARGEDTPVVEALARAETLVRIERPELYVYVVHGGNTFPGGHFERYTQDAFFLGDAASAEVAEALAKAAP